MHIRITKSRHIYSLQLNIQLATNRGMERCLAGHDAMQSLRNVPTLRCFHLPPWKWKQRILSTLR